MAGIYIHIPFCRKACHYCNFHFSTSLQKAPEVLKSIEKEMEIRSEEINEEINTVYFGGGTPSLIESESIASILNQANKYFKIAQDAEITLEANPDDINLLKAKNWKSMGINRFSLGIQSFADENLQWMNRAHNAVQSFAAIEIIRNAGFENFSIDLIYGTPGQSMEGWLKDIETTLKLNIPHLSCYALTVEEKTALQTLIQKGEKQEVNQDEQAERFNILMELTAEAGYHHYEISNLALPGFESKHNSSYWEGLSYIGFGPSAHSYDGEKRKWNIANNIKYVEAIAKHELPLEEETLSQNDKLNEYTMTSIRRSKGIEKNRLIQMGGEKKFFEIKKMIQPYLENNKVVEDEKGWRLTNQGKFFADGIAASLFILD
jgi:oxygen-independent coproporphyrinogen-3 oxidase